MRIRETIIVEGRDDTARIRDAVEAETIETHGFGIRPETWDLMTKAYETTGIIILTDPDHAGEEIRRRVRERFPDAKEAFLAREDAASGGDIGVENATPEAIRTALARACQGASGPAGAERSEGVFGLEDLQRAGLVGSPQAAERRQAVGRALGIGYGNAKAFLRKLNHYGITREAWDAATKEPGTEFPAR